MEKFIALTTVAAFLIFAGTYALSVRKATGAMNESQAPYRLPARSASRNPCSQAAVVGGSATAWRMSPSSREFTLPLWIHETNTSRNEE